MQSPEEPYQPSSYESHDYPIKKCCENTHTRITNDRMKAEAYLCKSNGFE